MIEGLDRALFLAINSFHFTWLNTIMVLISGQLIWLPVLMFFIIQSRSKLSIKTSYYFIGFLILVIISSDVTSSYLFKNLFDRMRPCRLAELKILIQQFAQKCGGKYGFVSSHAANSMGLITFSFLSLNLSLKKFWWLWLMPLFVGWSRIYLGVHYPGDILGGFIVGVSWGYVYFWFFNNRIKGPVSEGPNLKLV